MRRLLFGIVFVVACSSSPNVGGMCTASGGCDDDLVCDTTSAGGYCTKACATAGSTNECPEGSICDSLGGATLTCVKMCNVQEDCRTDQECNGITGSNQKACKPK